MAFSFHKKTCKKGLKPPPASSFSLHWLRHDGPMHSLVYRLLQLQKSLQEWI